MWLQTNSKAVAALKPNVGRAGGEGFSFACLMHCNVKYHLDSCQYITKYLKSKLPVGKDRCALKGRVRHDGLFLFTVFCMLLTKSRSFPFHRRVGCFFAGFCVCLLKVIEGLSKSSYSLVPYVSIKANHSFYALEFKCRFL